MQIQVLGIWRKANNKPELKEFIDSLDVNPDMWF